MNKNKKGFTLAEVLITLSIIGVVAAILFPSILANFTERTLNAKRQALFGRMSQAMGEMSDSFRNYESKSCSTDEDTGVEECVDNGSALKFINEGLSKTYKIAAICDSDNLSSCDIPDEITREDGSVFSLKDNGVSIMTYNTQIQPSSAYGMAYDTKSAGFMTKNGESILLFYNPTCSGKVSYRGTNYGYIYTESLMCINLVYDLNGGKQKPNRVGKDIGFMTVFYNDSPYVALARPYDWKALPDYEATTDASGAEVALGAISVTYEEAKAACSSLGENIGLPSREEGMAMQINRELWAPAESQLSGRDSSNRLMTGRWMWTSTTARDNYAWMYYLTGESRTNNFFMYTQLVSGETPDAAVRCVYKD